MDEGWFLESIAADESRRVQAISRLPFRVGRDPGNDLVVDALGLSRAHAVIEADGAGQLRLTDLGSTNGTFVNRARLAGPRTLAENDVIHFGNAEFRLGLATRTRMAARPADDGRTLIVPAGQTLSERFVQHERQFMELLSGRGLTAMVQPIVRADDGGLFAYELLGRGNHPDLPTSPVTLFHLAALLHREAELSAAFRDYGTTAVALRLAGHRLFVNTHPSETFAEGFFAGLSRLRAMPGAPRLVVEVHETAVMEVQRMRELKARLDGIGVELAFDDFGAGQTRLNELGDVTPHFVKFDMALVHRIHEATDKKQRVVRDLVRMVGEVGAVTLAEGVELEDEAAVCRSMGFQLIQGFLTGRPVPVQSI